jgi:hypothetical protein
MKIIIKIINFFNIYYILNLFKLVPFIVKYGDWGLGIGDWGLGVGAQTPTPKPQHQTPKPQIIFN